MDNMKLGVEQAMNVLVRDGGPLFDAQLTFPA